MANLFNLLLINPIINVLLVIYHGLILLHIPSALGFSLILLTVAIRLVMYPLTASQLLTSQKMQKLTPHLNKLKETHKSDATRLQQETMALYKEHGVNPASGCLSFAVQFPLIIALYNVLQHVVNLKPNETLHYLNSVAYTQGLKLTQVWDAHFFGLPLGQHPATLFKTVGPLILLVPLLTGALQYYQSRMMMAATPPAMKKEGQPVTSDMAQALQTQSLYVFPVMIGFFSWTFPLGLSLYWNTFTIFGIIQQYQVQKTQKAQVPAPVLSLPEKPKKKKK